MIFLSPSFLCAVGAKCCVVLNRALSGKETRKHLVYIAGGEHNKGSLHHGFHGYILMFFLEIPGFLGGISNQHLTFKSRFEMCALQGGLSSIQNNPSSCFFRPRSGMEICNHMSNFWGRGIILNSFCTHPVGFNFLPAMAPLLILRSASTLWCQQKNNNMNW